MNLYEWWQLLGADLTKEQSRALWQAGSKVAARGWLLFFSLLSFGTFASFGMPGFVRADDVDKKIAAALGPVSAALAQVVASNKQSAEAQNEQTLALLRVAITDGLVKMCHAPKGETKLIYRKQVDDAQARYYHLTGTYYPEHSCADL